MVQKPEVTVHLKLPGAPEHALGVIPTGGNLEKVF